MAIPKLIRYSDNSFVTSQGTLLEGFETLSDWTVGGTGATQEADSTHRREGIQSLKLNATGGNMATSTKVVNLDLSAMTNIIFWVYIEDLSKLNANGIHIYLSTTTDFSKYFWRQIEKNHHKQGWNRFVLCKDLLNTVGSPSWSNPILRLRVVLYPDTGESTSASFDDLRYDYAGKAKCIITFDDNYVDHYTRAKPIMDGNGQAGVEFCVSGLVDDGDHLTKAQLTAMQTAGWDIANHTENHYHLTEVSQVTMEEDIDNGYDWLVANGFGKGAPFFAYPGHYYNQAVITKLKERHQIARDGMVGWYQPHLNLNDDDIEFLVKVGFGVSTNPPATIQSWIDHTITHKGLLVLMFHAIVESGATGTQYNVADFETVSDYLKTKEDAEDIDVITFSDYYDQFMPTDLTSVVYLEHAAIVPYPIAYAPSESMGRAEDGRIKVYKHPLAGDRKRLWRIKCRIDNSGSSGYKWRDLEYFYVKVVEGAKYPCVYVDANSVQHLVRIVDFVPRVIAAKNKHEVTMILEEDYA